MTIKVLWSNHFWIECQCSDKKQINQSWKCCYKVLLHRNIYQRLVKMWSYLVMFCYGSQKDGKLETWQYVPLGTSITPIFHMWLNIGDPCMQMFSLNDMDSVFIHVTTFEPLQNISACSANPEKGMTSKTSQECRTALTSQFWLSNWSWSCYGSDKKCLESLSVSEWVRVSGRQQL